MGGVGHPGNSKPNKIDSPKICHIDLTGSINGKSLINTEFHKILPTSSKSTKIVIRTKKDTIKFFVLSFFLLSEPFDSNVSVVKKGVTAASYAEANVPPIIV